MPVGCTRTPNPVSMSSTGDPGLGGGLQRLDSAFGQGQLVQRGTFSGGFRHSGLIQCGTRGLPMELAVAVLAGQIVHQCLNPIRDALSRFPAVARWSSRRRSLR